MKNSHIIVAQFVVAIALSVIWHFGGQYFVIAFLAGGITRLVLE